MVRLRRIGLAILLVGIGVAIGVWWTARGGVSVTPAAPGPSLEFQAKCSAKADEGGLWSGTMYSSHYNARLGRCFVTSASQIETNDPHGRHQPSPTTFETRELFDAFEGRSLAIIRLYGDQPGEPIWCSVELPSGEHKSCRNEPEWESLVRVYLEK
jgi:hypothetical protein